MNVDYHFITARLAVGGGIWTRENFEELMRAGITHVINTQMEFDDRTLMNDGHPSSHRAGLPSPALGTSRTSEPEILWLPMDDDFQPKPARPFFQGAKFALAAWEAPEAKVLVHCASGIHRAPMVALALLRVLGYSRRDAIDLLLSRRPVADFPPAYLDSVEDFYAEWTLKSD